jgi:tRNA A37 threonylcarbamoyladenosine biosynthesis protein TsaE
MEKVMNWDSAKIRKFFASQGLTLLEWEKVRTDMLTIQDATEQMAATPAS